MRCSPGWWLPFALAACAPGPDSPAASAALPLYPMSLVFDGPREAGEPVGALLADGSIVTKREGLVARLLPDRVTTPDGRPTIVVSPNGDVRVDPSMPPMRFDARGALVSPQGETIWVDDSGVPTWNVPGRGMPRMGVHFTPFSPVARRTSEVLLIVLMQAAWSRPFT